MKGAIWMKELKAPLNNPFSAILAQALVTAPTTGIQAANPIPWIILTNRNTQKPAQAAGGHKAVDTAEIKPTTVNVFRQPCF
jgi:hypothetical protein